MTATEGESFASADLACAHMYGAEHRGTSFDGADLRQANLQNAILTGSTFVGANLRAANLAGARLSDVDFSRADLRGTVLLECGLNGCDFAGADLSGAVLAKVRLWEDIRSVEGANVHGVQHAPPGFVEWALERGAVDQAPRPDAGDRLVARMDSVKAALESLLRPLEMLPFHRKRVHERLTSRGSAAVARWRANNPKYRLTLEGACLRNAPLENALLQQTDLRGADLMGATLTGATLGGRLDGARLDGADLRYADVSGSVRKTSFRGADLRGALFGMATCDGADLEEALLTAVDATNSSFRSAILRGVELANADLNDCAFDGADLRGASFRDARLYRASFVGCSLGNVDLTGANLSEADLRGVVDHTSIASIEGASVAGVRNAPDGFVEWALENGAEEESRNRSWAPAEDGPQSDARAERERRRAAKKLRPVRRIVWAVAAVGVLVVVTGLAGVASGLQLLPGSDPREAVNLLIVALSGFWTAGGVALLVAGTQNFESA